MVRRCRATDEHHVLLDHVAAGRARVDAAMAGIDDDHGLGVPAVAPGESSARVPAPPWARGAGGGSVARKLARSVGVRSRLRCATGEPGGATMRRLDSHRPRGIDDDARFAGREQAVAVGLDQARALLAGPLGRRKLTSGMSMISR